MYVVYVTSNVSTDQPGYTKFRSLTYLDRPFCHSLNQLTLSTEGGGYLIRYYFNWVVMTLPLIGLTLGVKIER